MMPRYCRPAVLASLIALTAMVSLTSCTSTGAAILKVTQSSDAPLASDHKGHLVPAAFTTITITIKNSSGDPARGVSVSDLLPSGFQYYQLTSISGNAIRTAIQDPALQGNPRWGTWTIPASNSLVLVYTIQAALKPGEYLNTIDVTSNGGTQVQPGAPVAIVIDPRPALTLTAAATSGQVTTGSVATYVVSVTNVGSAVARGVAVSASLPPGFIFLATTTLAGNGTRLETVDPPGDSLLPLWASWDIPAASGSNPGLLQITFQTRVLPAVAPAIYSLTVAVTGTADIPPQTLGGLAPVAVGKGTTIPVIMTVAATSPYAAQNGTVTYVITLENDSTQAAAGVTVTDTLPAGFTYASTDSIVINGGAAGSRLQPAVGANTPQWGPFGVPAGGFSGATLVITFTAQVNASAALGPHSNVVSGSGSNAQITGGSDARPVTVTAG